MVEIINVSKRIVALAMGELMLINPTTLKCINSLPKGNILTFAVNEDCQIAISVKNEIQFIYHNIEKDTFELKGPKVLATIKTTGLVYKLCN